MCRRSGYPVVAAIFTVTIDDIEHLNNFPDDNIYQGGKLLVGKEILEITETPTGPPTFTATASLAAAVIGIVALALLAGGVFTRFGSAKKP